jgi:hypothetical protein
MPSESLKLKAAELEKVRAQHITMVRALLRSIPLARRCDPKCKGWAVFNESEGRPEIQVCDSCTRGLPVSDYDVAVLPEAQMALSGALARLTALEAEAPTVTEEWKRWRAAEPRG